MKKTHTVPNLITTTVLFALLMPLISSVQAAPLSIAREPLFLGYTVDPNVFFELDDSGSMDWSITTIPYWNACRYDANHPATSCSSSVEAGGLWNNLIQHYYRRRNTTDPWTPWYNESSYFYYIFDNGSDNLYGNSCRTINDCRDTIWNYNSTYEILDQMAYNQDWRPFSSDFNVVYYNPAINYSAWRGTGMGNATFTSVRSNPQSGQTGYTKTLDLSANNNLFANHVGTGFVYEVWEDTHGYSGDRPDQNDRTTGSNGWVDVWDEHDRYIVTATSITRYRVSYTSVAGVLTEVIGLPETLAADSEGRTLAEAQQNIANWYQYARRRMFVAKGAISMLVDENPRFRFGMTVINRSGNSSGYLFEEMPAASVTDYTSHNTSILDSLFKFPQPALGTPLRRGLDNAGRYYSHQQNYDGVTRTSPITESCQQNFTVLFTDGYYNGSSPSTTINDRDGDGRSVTLGDIALYYRDHDIDSSKSNDVPLINGGTTFQHMVTFTAAFGVQGRLLDLEPSGDLDNVPDHIIDFSDGDIDDFTASQSAQWGDSPFDTDPAKIDDMWHAAYNSGGKFISAKNPTELVQGMRDAMSTIEDMTSSSSAIAASTGQYQEGTMLYLAKFDSGNWTGDLEEFPIIENNGEFSISTNSNWSAAEKLDDQVSGTGYDTGRQIITYNPNIVNGSRTGKGIPFRFPSNYKSLSTANDLNATQVQALIPHSISTTDPSESSENQTWGSNLLNFLRGDKSNEGSVYRTRDFVLGDLINSSPQFVKTPRRLFPDDMESDAYSAFRRDKRNRDPILYTGGNDGMLHGFNATDGTERFAYVPSAVYTYLSDLSDKAYSHRFYVDSTPLASDAFIDSNWATVLVAGLGGGGQGIYALDITNPNNLTEAQADKVVLWEFNDRNTVASLSDGDVGSNGDKELGYTYSRPVIAKMNNNQWVAIFGNGYNNTEADGSASTTGHAYLYIVDLETGTLIKRFDTGVGSSTTPNGLSTPAIIDLQGDYRVDYIYAGDLQGNMWRFDVSSNNTSAWKLSFSGSPLFKTATNQPITVKPAAQSHPTGRGLMLYFGTGKYIEETDGDPTGKPTQSFYAVWDDIGNSSVSHPIAISSLLEQEILAETTHSAGAEVRVSTDNSIDWLTHKGWYIDLIYNGNNKGELVATDALVRADRVIFISIQPSPGACSSGGSSWIGEFDAVDGGRLPSSPIDINNDGEINDDDLVNHSGQDMSLTMSKTDNIITTPTILTDTIDTKMEHKVMSDSSGSITEMGESRAGMEGRTSWRRLK